MQYKLYLFTAILMTVLMGCATFSDNAYKTLAVGYQGYDTTMSVLGDMYQAGQLPEEVKDKAIEYGTLYMEAHNEAVGALHRYLSDPTESKKQVYLNAAIDAGFRLGNLFDLAKPYLQRGE